MSKKSSLILVIIGLLGLHLMLLSNLRFTAWPEMVSYPYLLNNGFKLYTDFVHPYPPLLTMILAGLYKVFGYTLWILKIFTWSIIIANDILLFLISKKLTGKNLLSLSVLFLYVVFQPFLEGNQLWFDLAVVLPVLFGTLMLLDKKYFWAGVGFALATLIKQTTGLFLVFAFINLLFQKTKPRNLASFLAGPIILEGTLLFGLAMSNTLADFINWTLVYPFTFWSRFPGYVQLTLGKSQLLIIGALFLPLILNIAKIKKYGLIFLFLVISLILVYPRFSFFHFQLALAYISILYGVTFTGIKNKFFYILFLVPLVAVLSGRQYAVDRNTRFWGGQDLIFAEQLKGIIGKDKNILLVGSPSSLYVLSENLPPKPWVDNFGWYWEVPGFQEKVIKSWEQNKPLDIVWQEPGNGNWFDLETYQPKKVTDWLKANYNKNEEIEPGVFHWTKKPVVSGVEP
mgnify:FL=1